MSTTPDDCQTRAEIRGPFVRLCISHETGVHGLEKYTTFMASMLTVDERKACVLVAWPEYMHDRVLTDGQIDEITNGLGIVGSDKRTVWWNPSWVNMSDIMIYTGGRLFQIPTCVFFQRIADSTVCSMIQATPCSEYTTVDGCMMPIRYIVMRIDRMVLVSLDMIANEKSFKWIETDSIITLRAMD